MNLKTEAILIPTENKLRTIRILLPENYDSSNQSYDVLYMHDGQNLFEDHLSFSGHAWQIDETLKKMKIKNLIVVGIDNSDLRLFEYAPWPGGKEATKFTKVQVGGLGSLYAYWIVHTLKPFIDKRYRTKPERSHTHIAGSSMGAYISVYIATAYPHIFQTVGSFSLSSWFNETDFLQHLDQSNLQKDQRYFISVGRYEESKEPSPVNDLYIQNSITFKDKLMSHGVCDITFILTDDSHNELSWRKIFPKFIEFINQKSTHST
ncbi:MAG: hypothetical protein A2Y45_03615 [Tenericutes bacterium GWC2_34_14]|nr:MAG: hypothetical protein US32_C0002G0006 [candidate division TM6 bacterium GW2011_GWA2_36_9]OHE29222.1 MAG: hypothetical protein A2Y45_03615 [Tenericutes bacterium GWC2_34_14]OHE34305.1 MAG: hypothetical protein A2012_09205 [Tenericutes bacterium GWE2_34_108]OHE35657.1 MAG: hypothetical protein A2Y46_05970 [Tenericutes bacterium GWF1_35_14]OHE38872.1 MAG: hypothetical protein A2Y44_00405 [Tenericutes bacterium GWF2_35_184]OHE43904.1 MAG: hypothetical protein A2221_10300 [Tenericutes bacter